MCHNSSDDINCYQTVHNVALQITIALMQSACHLKAIPTFTIDLFLFLFFIFFISFNFQLARSYLLITFYQSSILCTSLWKQLSDNFSSLIYFFHNLIHLKENIKWVGEMIKVFEGLYFPLYLLDALLFVI